MAVARFLLTLSILAVAGCGGGPERTNPQGDSPSGPATGNATLQVIVWSTASRRAVPATGTVTTEGQTLELDTRSASHDGQTFRNLGPGLYRVELDSRYEDDEAHRVTGSESIYLEPGATEEVTVVAIDRPGDN